MYRQSTTVRAAIRLAVAPDRSGDSRAAVVSTRSAWAARSETGKLVIAIVVAPAPPPLAHVPAVPEPAPFLALAIGLLALYRRMRRA